MEKELLKYCKYYKGEDKDPCNLPKNASVNYWLLEKRYVDLVYKEKHDYWENDGFNMCVSSFPDIKDYMNGISNKFLKGMNAYFVISVYDHTPMSGVKFIFDYGNK